MVGKKKPLLGPLTVEADALVYIAVSERRGKGRGKSERWRGREWWNQQDGESAVLGCA